MKPTDKAAPTGFPLGAGTGTAPAALVRALDRARLVRIVAAISTAPCREAADRHQCTPAVACALSRALTASVLLATLTKGGERVTIQISCDGPLKGLTADTYDDGAVRAYPSAPRAWEGRTFTGRQRLSDLLGDGVVNVLRDVGLKENYQGQVALCRGEVDEDLEQYLLTSEQVPSALGCEVRLDPAGQVVAAGGLLAQVMPDGDAEAIFQVQAALRSGRLFQALAEPGVTPEALCQALLPQSEIEILDRRPLRFRCRCSPTRIEAMLTTLSVEDLAEMIAAGKPAEITCNYCNQVYSIPVEALERVQQRKRPRETN